MLVPVVMALPAAAEAQSDAATDTLRGFVRDANTGAPLSGARVRLPDLRQGMLTDEVGRFAFGNIARGVHLVTVEGYGYGPAELRVDMSTGTSTLAVFDLLPLPVMLDGLEVVTERLQLMETRLRSRRRAAPFSARAFEQERLLRSPARDLLDFLAIEASLLPTSCGGRASDGWCVMRRGRAVQPKVYIDEAPVIGGLDQLATYRPHELHLVEVYSSGLEIRAYTHRFMERMARRPVLLIPVGVGR